MQDNIAETPNGADKKISKPRPTTVYKQAIRTIRKAAELVSKIDGCDDAKGKLERFADQLLQTLEEMKSAKKAGKKKAAAVPAPTTPSDEMGITQTT